MQSYLHDFFVIPESVLLGVKEVEHDTKCMIYCGNELVCDVN